MALYEACLNLEESLCDVALVAGYDSLLNVSSYLAYEERGLLAGGGAAAALRPFDRNRDGAVLGEAAGVLVLERPADARRRGAQILGEITGFGAATDCADAPEPADPARVLAAAVEAAGGPDAGFVTAHGIGTAAGDRWEAGALASALGARIPVTSLKGYTGYVGAATAAVEIGIGLMAIRSGALPMVAGLREPDPDFNLNLVRGAARSVGAGGGTGLFVSWSCTGQCTVVRVRAGR
jgi:3-oxoacyl-[acyl-carrier-protein] synthase II